MTPPTDTSHGTLLLGIVAVASGIANFVWVLMLIIGRGQPRRIEPTPLEVKPAEQWLPRHEWMMDHGAITERLKRIEDDISAIRSDGNAGREALREELNTALVRVHQRLDEANETLTNTPASIIAILRNTGVIK